MSKQPKSWRVRALEAEAHERELRAAIEDLHRPLTLPGSAEPYLGVDYRHHCRSCGETFPCATASLVARLLPVPPRSGAGEAQ